MKPRKFSKMQQQEWERTKSFLIRDLFDELPPLSPIPEEDSPSQISTRPYSPLPDLIIEKTKPVNKHDEPEEYYEELDRKMHVLYRKLFFDDDGSGLDEAEDLLGLYVPYELHAFDAGEDSTNSVMEVDQSRHFVIVRSSASVDSMKDRPGNILEYNLEDNAFREKIDYDSAQVDLVGKVTQNNVKPDQDYVETDSNSNAHNDSSPQGAAVQIITCKAQIHRVMGDDDSNIHVENDTSLIPYEEEESVQDNEEEGEESTQDDGECSQNNDRTSRQDDKESIQDDEEMSFEEEESQIWQAVESSAVTRRGEFIDIELSALAGDPSESGENRVSNPDVITVDSSASSSHDTLEIMRYYNVRRHSMGSIRFSETFNRLSSSVDLTFTRSRSSDPVIEVHRYSADLKNNEINASLISEDKNTKAFDTSSDSESQSSESEKVVSGIGASTPMSVRESDRSTSGDVSELNTARISSSFACTSNGEDEFEEAVSAKVSSFPSKGVKRKCSSICSEDRRVKRMRVERAQPLRGMSWQELKSNFFVGNPTEYRLCSCVDHTCNN